MLGILGYTFLP